MSVGKFAERFIIVLLSLIFSCCGNTSDDTADFVPYIKDGKYVYSDNPVKDGLILKNPTR
jgi:hypothetical protein